MKWFLIFTPYILISIMLITSLLSIFFKCIRERGPIYKNVHKALDKELNPHWYTTKSKRSYIMRFIQIISILLSILSPTENVKAYFSYENTNNKQNRRIKCHEKYISSAYITEFMTLFNIIYATLCSLFIQNIIGFNNTFITFYIAFEIIILFDRISYKSFLKFIFYPERKVHNIGRSIVIFTINYIYVIIGFSVIYQNNEIIFNHVNMKIIDYFYFSVATITTLGFGDIYVTSDLGKTAVILESLFGIWLLVVAIGKFIGSLSNPIES